MGERTVSVADVAARIDGARVVGSGDVVLAGVVHDSRRASTGDLFVAIVGFRTDGHDHVPAAIEAGAAAAVVERELAIDVPQIVVPDARAALAVASAAVYGDPSAELAVVGITGTNGKTTVSYMVESILAAAGLTSAVVGTVGARVAGEDFPLERTTPEADDLQRLLAAAVARDAAAAVVEVSSHALELRRVDGIRFAIGAFTNLSRDHLDFHRTMDAYYEAKASLFVPDRVDQAVICIDDEAGRRIAARGVVPTITVSIEDPAADVVAGDIEVGTSGSSFVADLDGSGPVRFAVPVTGRFNVRNALVAATIAIRLGIAPASIAAGLSSLRTIPGRLERVPGDRHVVVDYAHTPDAVATVVAAARELTDSRVIVVVGAGGDRDREKRPEMGRAAAAADIAIITSDNPRSEDPASIVEAVAEGARSVPGAIVVDEPDRRAAIRRAIDIAGPDDLVLILGKGHERGQEIDGVVHPFDDRAVAAEILASRAHSGAAR